MTIIRLPWALSCLALVLFSQLLAAEDADVEYKIKAGYLYNFTKFITWPEDNFQTFNLCILGDDPFGRIIDPIEKRSAFGRSIKLFRFNNLNAFRQSVLSTHTDTNNRQQCHILFISASLLDNDFSIKDFLASRDGDKTLTVGESEGFAIQGGMIGFVNRQGKIKLQINMNTLKHSNLKISAKLLEVAELVDGEGSD
ncbi:MAG: YfiR family protein [Methylobacter sp.]|nr:YfiR family protein [Methylobacter sp.]